MISTQSSCNLLSEPQRPSRICLRLMSILELISGLGETLIFVAMMTSSLATFKFFRIFPSCISALPKWQISAVSKWLMPCWSAILMSSSSSLQVSYLEFTMFPSEMTEVLRPELPKKRYCILPALYSDISFLGFIIKRKNLRIRSEIVKKGFFYVFYKRQRKEPNLKSEKGLNGRIMDDYIVCIQKKMEDDQQYTLPQALWCYKRAFQALNHSKSLFKALLIEHGLCLRCIYRIYGFEQPRLYSDPAFAVETLPVLLNCSPQDELLRRYRPGQWGMAEICWACAGVLQRGVIRSISEQTLRLIEEKGYKEWVQFKLNIRIPNLIILRTLVLARYLYFQAKGTNDPALSQLYYNILILPIEANKTVQHKTVMKWVLAHQLSQRTGMGSTSDQNDQNLVISIEVELQADGSEAALMKVFSSHLGLQKKKEKAKGRRAAIDLGEEREVQHAIHPQEYKCNANNLNKIVQLKQAEFDAILAPLQNKQAFCLLVTGSPLPSAPAVSHKVVLLTRNVYLCGRYIKFSRYLSQTPWVVDGKKLTQGSLQEQIQDRIYRLFYPGRRKEDIEIKFHSGGREDIDVRMLKGGRPFVLQFVNPIKSIAAITVQQVLALAPERARQDLCKQFGEWAGRQGSGGESHSWRVVKMMELLINHNSQYVQVLDLQETTESFISVELKAAETEKIKHYICYIYSVQPLTQDDRKTLQSVKDLPLQQLTPLRVLHRRTLMSRQKLIHRLKAHLVSGHSAILEVWASAGTYIKQFVHGDLGRTLPNVGSLLGKEVDILQLDVGSLKEGEWRSGDEESMKMERFQWMD